GPVQPLKGQQLWLMLGFHNNLLMPSPYGATKIRDPSRVHAQQRPRRIALLPLMPHPDTVTAVLPPVGERHNPTTTGCVCAPACKYPVRIMLRAMQGVNP